MTEKKAFKKKELLTRTKKDIFNSKNVSTSRRQKKKKTTYALNTKAPKYMKLKLKELKRERDN